MFKFFVEKVVGSRNERVLRKLWPTVDKINSIYETYHTLSDEDILKKTEDFEKRLRDGEDSMSVLPESFALVKEVCRRLMGKKWDITEQPYEWDMIPFDVQLLGAIVLHQGNIAEMATGEGKTLVATMPLYLNALMGRMKNRGVHLITVNDYLARRDKEWMGPVYESLGVSVGVIQGGMDPQERKPEYEKDITYGTNNEFGFDYLRDNMVFRPEDRVQRGHFYAIIDEVDSILIDEARTPLIISGPVEHSSVDQYYAVRPYVDSIVRKQILLLNKKLTEAERLLKQEQEHDAAILLLQVKRGGPKSKRLFKILQEPGLMKMVDKVELEMMKQKKMRDLDEELYFVIDEKSNSADVTEKGRVEIQKNLKDVFLLPDLSTELERVEKMENLLPRERFVEKEKIIREYAEKSDLIHAIQQLLKAYSLFEKDVDYVIMDGKVVIVDEFTGRLMPGRRWSDGLHEAVEAKEGVKVQAETQTLATITLQNYFRMYEKLAGMTGTAATEAAEFWEIYKLDVVIIPTNRPVRRIDYPDLIYKTKKEKYEAVIEEITKWHERGRPILVGTTSVDVSELLSRLLKRKGIPHQVLNAKHHQKEAMIISRAGHKGAVTIATNMAGRGTDIKLGPGVLEGFDHDKIPRENWGEWGLYVIGTERHEARRIDNQLRGRSGRQGDPGGSRFFLSLEDDLLRLFGSDKVMDLMERFGKKEEGPMESRLVTKALENAQKRVEMQNFEIRKRLLEYDDVMNRQREVIYGLRNDILDGADLRSLILESYVGEIIEEKLDQFAPKGSDSREWDLEGLRAELAYFFLSDFSFLVENPEGDREAVKERIFEEIKARYKEREEAYGDEKMREYEGLVLLSTLDRAWREHLYSLDHLKEGIFLRAYAQKDPLVQYKQESFRLFDELLIRIRNETVMSLMRLELPKQQMPRRYRERVKVSHPIKAGVPEVGKASDAVKSAHKETSSGKKKAKPPRPERKPKSKKKRWKR